MEKSIETFISLLVRKGFLKKEKQEWGKYLLFKMMLALLNYTMVLLIGFLTGKPVEIIAFMIVFISVRMRAGGFHADHYLKCLSITIFLSFCCPLFVDTFEKASIFILIAILALSFLITYLYAPINHPNMKLDKQEIKALKKASIQLSLKYLICMLLLLAFSGIRSILLGAIYGYAASALSILIAKVLKQEVKNNEFEREIEI